MKQAGSEKIDPKWCTASHRKSLRFSTAIFWIVCAAIKTDKPEERVEWRIMEPKVELVHFSPQTEIEPANQSYPNRSEARIGHLFKQMTNINRRLGRCRGRGHPARQRVRAVNLNWTFK